MNDLSVEKKMRFALAGNPNCGKSTFFNLMTGQQRPVGNLSGVTVEKYVGTVKKGVSQKNIELCDLPGMYSADPLGAEERIAAEELKSGAYDCIINIIDGTNLERQLYLTLQLRMTGKPMVVGVNMADILKEQGIYIDYKKLGRLLGNVEVLPISAKRGTGTKELICAAEKACKIKNDSLPDFVSADFQSGFIRIMIKY